MSCGRSFNSLIKVNLVFSKILVCVLAFLICFDPLCNIRGHLCYRFNIDILSRITVGLQLLFDVALKSLPFGSYVITCYHKCYKLLKFQNNELD